VLTETLQGFELSPQQRRIWSLRQRDINAANRGLCVIAVKGELNPRILAKALQNVVDRNELLRTSFLMLPGMPRPLQVISEETELAYSHYDLSAQPPAAKQANCTGLINGAAGPEPPEPNDAKKPNLCVTHVTLETGKHMLALTLPALCADAVSLCLSAGQIRQAYICRRDGSKTPDRPVQYADVAQTLNECLESDEFDFARRLWRERVAKSLAFSDYPFEPATTSFLPREVRVPVSDSLAAKASEFCERSGISREGLLLTCWTLLMGRIAAGEEGVIGVCCDGRTHDVLRETLGPLSRHLPFAFQLQRDDTFEHTARVTEALRLQLADEQHYFDPAAFNATEAAAREYDACFEYARLSGYGGAGEPVFETESLSSISNRFAIKLTILEDEASLRCQLQYDLSTISERDASRAASCFSTLLDSALRRPEARASTLMFLRREEKRAILAGWRGPEARLDRVCAHTLFERQARQRSDSVVLVYEDHQLSFDELNRRANQLSQYLRSLGVGPEARVGLLLERSVEIVVGLLGVMKAGASYLPLDSSYPTERLAYMLEDVQASVLITERALLNLLPERSSVVCLDRDWELIGQYCDKAPAGPSMPENLAYVIYTSGSSGRPKGVGIEHRQLVNYIETISARLKLQPGWRMAMVSTFAADLGHTMLYPSLCLGGELHLVSEERCRDPRMWMEHQSERQIDCLKITPTHLEALVEDAAGLPLNRLILGGEACSSALVKHVKQLSPRCEIYNHYGPTECTVGAVTHRLKEGEEGVVPIGAPLGNIQTYMMDMRMELTLLSAPAELYVGGAGVGRAYLNDPGQTAERFVPDDLSEELGARLYRTGDKVQRREDGELEYIGRLDKQVKLRGYRIELGEIEAVLAEHNEVRQCAVCLSEGETNTQLVAYVVPSEGSARDVAEWKDYLRRKLPEYMVPSAFVELARLPLTSNGKLDRRALPAPGAVETTGPSTDSTPIEEIVAGIFAQVLRLDQVGRDQSFFDLGGHSLLATQVISRVRDVLGVEAPLRGLFDDPTVAGLAALVERERAAGVRVEAPPITSVCRDGLLPLSFAQQRLWFLDQLTPSSSVYNMPSAVRFVGAFNAHALENSLSEIVRRNEVLRTRFSVIDGVSVQVITQPLPVELPVIDLSRLQAIETESQTRRIAEEEARWPFDLAQGPHLRGRLLKTDEQDHVVLFTMHHIVADGWSIALLVNGVRSLYQAFRQGEESTLPELSIQYADFALWQRDWLKGEVLEAQLGYWTQQLAGHPPLLDIGTDRPRPDVPSYRGAQRRMRMSKQTSDSVKALSRTEGVTLFMTLLAAFNALLHCYTGQEDLMVGTDVANRNRGEIEELIGFFVNQLVMRVDLSGNPTFQELLGRVREVALGAYAHQELPFEKLVEALKPERSLGRTPLFQVKMILQNLPEVRDETIGEPWASAPIEIDLIRSAEVDMNLIIHDTPQGLASSLRYSTDLFDDTTASRYLVDYQIILDRVTAQPLIRLNELADLIRESHKQELISRRNGVRDARRLRLKRLSDQVSQQAEGL